MTRVFFFRFQQLLGLINTLTGEGFQKQELLRASVTILHSESTISEILEL